MFFFSFPPQLLGPGNHALIGSMDRGEKKRDGKTTIDCICLDLRIINARLNITLILLNTNFPTLYRGSS